MDPDNPDDVELEETFGSDIRVAVNRFKRPNVSRYFENWADQTCVVNGIMVGSIAHDPCMYRILTGTPSSRNPDLATMVGAVYGRDLPLGSLDTSGQSMAGGLGATAGRLGSRSQIATLLDPYESIGTPGAEVPGPRFVPDPSEAALLDEFLNEGAARYAASRADAAGSARLEDLAESRSRASRLLAQRDVFLDHLRVGLPPSTDATIALMVEVFSQDLCRAITIDTGSGWDTHTDSRDQHGNFDRMFRDLDAIVGELHRAALLESTLVVAVSEMTRTPRYNAVGGKDHWPHTSAMLVGGPARGGRCVGATDDALESVPVDFATGEPTATGEVCRYDNFVAGLLAILDVDPGDWLPGVTPFVAPGA